MRRGYQPTLAQVFSFDAVDLAANRAGQLSPDQAVMFTNMAGMARRRPWRVLVLLAFAVVVAIVMLAAQGAPADQLTIARLPDLPEGAELARVDVVIRLRRA